MLSHDTSISDDHRSLKILAELTGISCTETMHQICAGEFDAPFNDKIEAAILLASIVERGMRGKFKGDDTLPAVSRDPISTMAGIDLMQKSAEALLSSNEIDCKEYFDSNPVHHREFATWRIPSHEALAALVAAPGENRERAVQSLILNHQAWKKLDKAFEQSTGTSIL